MSQQLAGFRVAAMTEVHGPRTEPLYQPLSKTPANGW